MGKQTLLGYLREWIGGIGFRVFLWSIRSTQDEYIEMILEDARREYQSEKNNSWFVK
jgi:nitrogen fixation-related uncharacterized protein